MSGSFLGAIKQVLPPVAREESYWVGYATGAFTGLLFGVIFVA